LLAVARFKFALYKRPLTQQQAKIQAARETNLFHCISIYPSIQQWGGVDPVEYSSPAEILIWLVSVLILILRRGVSGPSGAPSGSIRIGPWWNERTFTIWASFISGARTAQQQ
jgi:hypothetical protein